MSPSLRTARRKKPKKSKPDPFALRDEIIYAVTRQAEFANVQASIAETLAYLLPSKARRIQRLVDFSNAASLEAQHQLDRLKNGGPFFRRKSKPPRTDASPSAYG